MRQEKTLTHEFVEFIPDALKEGVLYVSMEYATVVHKCCCGCGKEVVTPLSPTDWKLIFDGKTISLEPSIGNWSFRCKSHYFIRRNIVIWAPRWSQKQINAERARDRSAKKRYYEPAEAAAGYKTQENLDNSNAKTSFWRKLIKWLWR